MTLAQDRILDRVEMVPECGCWIWMLSIGTKGYGYLWDGSRMVLAHRFAYEQWRGEVPKGMTLDHLCKEKLCCNPWHLEPCTASENRKRAAKMRLEDKLVKAQELYDLGWNKLEISCELGINGTALKTIIR